MGDEYEKIAEKTGQHMNKKEEDGQKTLALS
jgi:hypothetical protein